MTIGLLQLKLRISASRSLKDRRRALKSLKERIRNRFNCSVAEVGEKNNWQHARLAICVVSDDSHHANSQLDEIARFASKNRDAEITDYSIELL